MQPLPPAFPNLAQPDGPQPPGSLLEYWRIVRRRKDTLLVLTFIGGLSTFLLTLPQTLLYQARASIEIQSLNENFLNLRAVNPTTEAGALAVPEYDVQTQIRVLQSRSLIERAVKKLDHGSHRGAADANGVSMWRAVFGVAPSPAPGARSAALRFAAGSLKVRAQPNTRVIELTCDSTDPRAAADFLNTLTRELIDQNLESRWKTTETTGEWLARQMEGVRTRLEQSEEQLQRYARTAGLLFTSEKNNVAEDRLRQVQEELSKAQADRMGRQSKYETASAAAPASLPDVLDDDSLRASQARLTELRRELAGLASSFTAEHPKVRRVQAQIASLESSLAGERADILRRIHNDYQSALRRENLLAADYSAQVRLMSGQAGQVAHYNLIKREVDTNRQLYDSMLQRVKEAGVAAALRASNIRVIDQALPPAVPHKPNPLHNTLAGLLVGAVASVILVVTRDRADRTFRDPGDTTFYLAMPELGVIPRVGRAARRPLLPMPRALERLRGFSGGMELSVWPRKPCAASESFRAVTASILFSAEEGERPRVLVVSSPAADEGKTTVAANLAVALAETGCRVLAIDADLRKPGLHEAFGFDNHPGLADLLRRKDSVAEPFQAALRRTAIPGLTVLTGGRATFAESALLYSGRLKEVLSLARDAYDAVLIDTPPMATIADARVIARQSDGVILVARAGRTSRDSMRLACKRFLEDGTQVAGVVLNDWDPRHTSRYGGRSTKCYGEPALKERA